MQITFKDVGQGDSIIIEWEYLGINKVGIIDCKKKGKLNPVVNHLMDKSYSEIEFIILSHPHSDHYSGFAELLDFIEDRSIVVNKFSNTLKEIGSQYWKWFEVSYDETRQLEDIIRKANYLRERNLIKKFVPVFEDWSIPLSDDIIIRVISPSHEEIQWFQKAVQLDPEKNKKQASKAANFLSTVIYIEKNKLNILLTSDAELETFKRIHDEEKLRNLSFTLCQAPHHGSFNNYHIDFWDNLNVAEKRDAVFSAGLNEQYKHPHIQTIEGFIKNGYSIHPTNIVNGMLQYVEELNKKSLVLDTISEIDETSIIAGDKVFNF